MIYFNKKISINGSLPNEVCVIDRVLISKCDPQMQAYTKNGNNPTKKPRGNEREFRLVNDRK